MPEELVAKTVSSALNYGLAGVMLVVFVSTLGIICRLFVRYIDKRDERMQIMQDACHKANELRQKEIETCIRQQNEVALRVSEKLGEASGHLDRSTRLMEQVAGRVIAGSNMP